VLYSCTTYINEIHIVKHDTEITKLEIVTDPTEEKLLDVLKKYYGRGGTSHVKVFDYIESLYNNDEEISAIVFSTDFCSDVQSIYNNYEFIKNLQTIWVINKESTIKDVKLRGCDCLTFRIN